MNYIQYPLLSRCAYAEQIEQQPSISNHGYELKLQNFPGGAETFEIILKFCYGFPVSLNPRNAAPIRCAAEFLDMTEELEEGNLISKSESFLTLVVFSSWKDSITVLKSCESLSPWAENLQIVRRCCDSIAWAAEGNLTSTDVVNIEQCRCLINDLATLQIDHFMRIMTSMTLKGLRPEFLGKCIVIYAEKWLSDTDVHIEGSKRATTGKNEIQWSIQPGLRSTGTELGEYQEQRRIIECLVSILPHQKDAISCKFLLWMLKMAILYSVSPAFISELEKRVGMVMENATVYDLLIPVYRIREQGNQKKINAEQTLYNVDSVQRILEYFLMHEHQQQTQNHEKANISKLLDNYLAEIACDPNLSATKFQVIAESLPHNSRPCDDGLYRAIDIYLKAHPSLSEHDRRRLCRAMDCHKLSVDACTHAAKNDRLPLRTVMQVLLAEQLKMRDSMQHNQCVVNTEYSQCEDNYSSPKEEIKLLKKEVEKMMLLIKELQRNYTNLQQNCEKMTNKQNALSGWMLGWHKIKRSTLFHGKFDANESREEKVSDREEKEKEKSSSSMLRLKRRQSMS